jgi:hypothetical protein
MRVRSAEAGGLRVHRGDGVAIGKAPAARRAGWRASQITADVAKANRLIGVRSIGQRPLIDGALDLIQVIDAGLLVGFVDGLPEVGNGHRCQKAADGHHNHDFHQGKPLVSGFTQVSYVCFHSSPFSCGGVNETAGGL